MRKRSYTIEADTFEDYKKAAIENNPQSTETRDLSAQSRPTGRTRVSSFDIKLKPNNEITVRGRAFSGSLPDISLKETDEDLFYKFDYAFPTRTDSDNERDQTSVVSDDHSSRVEGPYSRATPIRCMVIGSIDSARYELVNNVFDLDYATPLEQTMDLLLKVEEIENAEKIYQFWILSLEENKYDNLVKIYYKNMSVFIFVYSLCERNSFDLVEKAISGVREERSDEHFVGILVGTKPKSDKIRQVEYEEGQNLKERFGLLLFIEASPDETSLKTTLQGILYHQARTQ